MNWILTRLSEPSSYAGLAAVSVGINNMVTAGGFDYGNALTALGGLLAFAIPGSAQAINTVLQIAQSAAVQANTANVKSDVAVSKAANAVDIAKSN